MDSKKSMPVVTALILTLFIAAVFPAGTAFGEETDAVVVVRKPTTTSTTTATKTATRSEFPSIEQVAKGYTKVVSTVDGRSMYTILTREKDGQMLAILPSGFESKRYFFAMTVASGQAYAGLQAGDMYVYWRRYNNRLALMSPNIKIRSYGDNESKSSVNRLFTDRVILDVPIVAMYGSSPVIDMDSLLVRYSRAFFGSKVMVSNPNLVKIKKAKAFPNNVELAFEVPAAGGQLQTMHYSISELPASTGYRARKADERIGYFATSYADFGDYRSDDINRRYINRWDLQKADPSLQLSPPKKPIVFYLEHTTPVRYRRWVREGVLYWNKAFEKVGISNAIEVYYQDRNSGAHMEKDPEDVRYNFIRWLSNNQGTAIGPSRVNPTTGQILDADIILTDGWIRHYQNQYHKIMPKIAMEGMGAETLAWLAENPDWDPRVRLGMPSERERIANEIQAKAGAEYGGHPILHADESLIGDDEFDGLARQSQVNGMCRLAEGMGMDVAMFRMMMDAGFDSCASCDSCKEDSEKEKKEKEEKAKKETKTECEKEKAECKVKEEKEKPEKPEKVSKEAAEKAEKEKLEKEKAEKAAKEAAMRKAMAARAKAAEPKIDGLPESFIGPLISMLTCHEVGHTLGLRHNFKGSAIYTMAEINSEKLKGKKPISSSIMDYMPVNMNHNDGKVQGDYCMIGIGEYDMWAIEYGYTQDPKKLKSILARVAEPKLQYATDEDTFGPDPLARRYDMSKEPLDYARNQVRIAKHNRKDILDKYVKDGQSWSRARVGYEMTLAMQLKSVSMMANWIGGAHIYKDKKGDKNGREPIEVVSADKQRKALAFVMENVFRDEAYGLDAKLLKHMSVDKWFDNPISIMTQPTWDVHDKILGIQASALTVIMNPMTLKRIYDNEFLVDADKDAFTIAELLDSLTGEIWVELDNPKADKYTARKPMISSLRRNLQREHIDRLISLCKLNPRSSAAYKPISNLAAEELRTIRAKSILPALKKVKNMDPYTRAHLRDAQAQIDKTLKGVYVIKSL